MPGLLAAAAGSMEPGSDPGFILGTTKPDAAAAAAGLIGRVSPTTSTDNSTNPVIGAGAPITGVLFNGNPLFTEERTLYNCRIRGKTSNTSQNIARTDITINDGVVVTFDRCQLDNRWFPTNGGQGGHGGIRGPKFKTIRCDISGAADGLGLLAPGFCSSFGDWVHGLWFTSPNSEHTTDGSHCDAMQGHGQTLDTIEVYGSNLEAMIDNTLTNSQAGFDPVYSGGNLIAGHPWHTPTYEAEWEAQGFDYVPWGTGAITLGWLTGNRLDNLWVHDAWLNGGSYAAVNIDNHWTNSNTSNLVFENIRLGPNTRDRTGGKPYFMICKNTLTVTTTGIVYENTGLPVLAPNLRRNG